MELTSKQLLFCRLEPQTTSKRKACSRDTNWHLVFALKVILKLSFYSPCMKPLIQFTYELTRAYTE